MATRLKKFREAAGLSQAQLAKASGIPLRTYQDWEYTRRSPLLESAAKVAVVLGVSLDDLAGIGTPRQRKRAEGK
jgi:transcriptional regulator with XRE-family HTH domain